MPKRRALVAFFLAAIAVACGANIYDEEVVLRPIRNSDSGADVDGDSSGVDASESNDAARDATVDVLADVVEGGRTEKYVFVTSQRYAGSFGSRANADAICTSLAKQASPSKFGASTFKAYLAAENGATAAARITDRVYVRIDGKPVFSPGPQTNTTPSDVVVFDEQGNNLALETNKFVWTGHANNVAAAERTCNDWTSDAGNEFGGFGDMHTTMNWGTSTGATAGCDSLYRLYCFED